MTRKALDKKVVMLTTAREAWLSASIAAKVAVHPFASDAQKLADQAWEYWQRLEREL